ncbi:integrase core domain-containing protein [Aidingimonas halophila]|uniref:integrase core domain-containing protein n=1 Tax=Aidingimonas halophila TaxID=574349 RepID=UPI0011147184|nr:hypothetical protein GCM10008094_09980 [Aidingimonas halophila]
MHIFYAALKEVCIWLNRLESLGRARAVINNWIRYYKGERSHQSLGYQCGLGIMPAHRPDEIRY